MYKGISNIIQKAVTENNTVVNFSTVEVVRASMENVGITINENTVSNTVTFLSEAVNIINSAEGDNFEETFIDIVKSTSSVEEVIKSIDITQNYYYCTEI